MPTIQFKRGNHANLPTSGMAAGEPIVSLDRGNLYVADSATTKFVATPAIDALSAMGAVDTANDLLLLHDASSSGQKEKRITVDNFKTALSVQSVNYAAGLRSGGNFVAGLTHCANSTSNLAMANQNTVYYIPYFNHLTNPITAMGIIVATLQASQQVAMGIYSVGSDGNPGTLLRKITTNVDTTTTGIKIATLDSPLALPLGWCFVAALTGATTAQFESVAAGGANALYSFLGVSSTAQGHKVLLESVAGGWTQVPATPGGTYTASDANIPLIGLVA